MKNKAPLALMEQLIMILVFALASALCLRLFVYSDQVSVSGAARDQAAAVVQNAAEALKLSGGSMESLAHMLGGEADADIWRMGYDSSWQETDEKRPAFIAEAKITEAKITEDDIPLMGSAEVSASTADGKPLFQVTVCWQEESDGQ